MPKTQSNELRTNDMVFRTTAKPKKTTHYIKSFFSLTAKILQFLASIAGVILLVYFIFQLKVFSDKFQTVMELQGVINPPHQLSNYN